MCFFKVYVDLKLNLCSPLTLGMRTGGRSLGPGIVCFQPCLYVPRHEIMAARAGTGAHRRLFAVRLLLSLSLCFLFVRLLQAVSLSPTFLLVVYPIMAAHR